METTSLLRIGDTTLLFDFSSIRLAAYGLNHHFTRDEPELWLKSITLRIYV
jgi:hypothetical protein